MVRTNNIRRDKGERGAALVTVMLISALLLTACIAMLTAVGANSRNTTDVLAETKAYYAAESGLQASINVLRNGGVDYKEAVEDPDLSDHLTYTTVNGNSRVGVGSEVGYAINITDPDDSKVRTVFTTTITYQTVTGTVASGNKLIIGTSDTATNRVDIEYIPAGSQEVLFNSYSNPKLGTFQITRVNSGAALSSTSPPIKFAIDFVTSQPRVARRSIRGSMTPVTNAASPTTTITFDTQVYHLGGSEIELCNGSSTPPSTSADGYCATVSITGLTSTTAEAQRQLRAHLTAFEPYRLKISANGYGPNGSRKTLEGIVRQNFLDGLSSTSGMTMLGNNAVFDPGSGNPTYCGADPGIEPGEDIPNNLTCTIDPNNPAGPAIGVSTQTSLDNVNAALGNTAVIPAPALITDNPTWQQSTTELNNFISAMRTSAQHSGRYVSASQGGTTFQNANGAIPYMNASEYDTGQGLTFVEGDLTVGPIDGGGILIVTGNFTYNGGMNFRGLIVVAGLDGTSVTRSGAGSGVILGNLVIAPYNPNNLAAGWGTPRFNTNGGGSSDIMFSGYSMSFDGTSSVTDFMAGVAEK